MRRTDAFTCQNLNVPSTTFFLFYFLIYALKNNKIKKLDNWNLIWLHVRIKYNLSSIRELTFLWYRTHWLLHADVHHYGLRDSKTTPSISLSASIAVGSSNRWLRRFWTAAPAAFQHRSSRSTDLCKRFRESSRESPRLLTYELLTNVTHTGMSEKWNWWQRHFIMRTEPPGNQRLFKNTVYIGFLWALLFCFEKRQIVDLVISDCKYDSFLPSRGPKQAKSR